VIALLTVTLLLTVTTQVTFWGVVAVMAAVTALAVAVLIHTVTAPTTTTTIAAITVTVLVTVFKSKIAQTATLVARVQPRRLTVVTTRVTLRVIT